MPLAAVSGGCGLAYEVLYIRLLSNYFGDTFFVSALLLAAVFLGISFGAYQSWRFVNRLGLIEISIGACALATAFLFDRLGFDVVSLGGNSVLIGTFKIFSFLLLPGFLIGMCIPLFAEYRRQIQRGVASFSITYAIYNLGAWFSILLIEFVTIRYWGLTNSMYFLGTLNLIVGCILIFSFDQLTKKTVIIQGWHLPTMPSAILLLVSFSSGVFQLYCLKLASNIFGPLRENFAIILAAAIAGVAIGALIFSVARLGIQRFLLLTALALGVFLLGLTVAIEAWSSLASAKLGFVDTQFIKHAGLFAYCLPVFTMFGMVVPLFVRHIAGLNPHSNSIAITSQVLAASSFANGLGALCFIAFINAWFEPGSIGLAILLLLLLCVWLQSAAAAIRTGLVLASFACITIGATAQQAWPTKELLLGYQAIAKKDQLVSDRAHFEADLTYKSNDQNVSLIYFDTGVHKLVFNGYQSLTFGPKTRTNLHEAIVGTSPILFAESTEKALVFGLGTGITAGAAAGVYQAVDVVEINPAMFQIPKHFEEENFDLLQATNAKLKLEDGISTLVAEHQKFDVIINTVTSPRYYSAVKMYTADFYQLVVNSLNPGGVYSSWFDLNIGQTGIGLMLNTLESSFGKCRYFTLSIGYFNVVCGEGDLTYRPSVEVRERVSASPLVARIRETGFKANFEELMQGLEIDFSEDAFQRPDKRINTLDRPAIEYLTSFDARDEELDETLMSVIARDINFRKLVRNSQAQTRSKCRILQHMVRRKIPACS